VTACGKMIAVAIAITAVVFTALAIHLGGTALLAVISTSVLGILAHDFWKIFDNINVLVNTNCITNLMKQSFTNRKYDSAERIFRDSWLIGPITLAFVGCH
jgi:hypothetical protein